MELRDIGADFRHDPGDLMAKHCRCRKDRVGGEEQVRVTESRASHINKNLAPNRRGDVYVLEIELTTDCVKYKRLHVRPPYVRTDLAFQSGRDRNKRLALCWFRAWPLSPNRFGLWFLLGAFHVHESNLTESFQCVQDIFTIRPIAIKYQNGIAASEIFRCDRRGAALRARRAQAARGPARAFAPDSGFGGGSRLQAFRTPSARREIECSR